MLVMQILLLHFLFTNIKFIKNIVLLKKYKNYIFLVKRIHSEISYFPLQIVVIKIIFCFKNIYLSYELNGNILMRKNKLSKTTLLCYF